jgi:hypothetical protein
MDLQTVTQMRKVVRTSGIARQAYQDALPTAFGSEAWQKYFEARDAVRVAKIAAIDAGTEVE